MTDEEKAALEAEKLENPLKGTFFDTFEFTPTTEKTPEEIAAEEKAKADEEAEAKKKAESGEKTPEEIAAEEAEAKKAEEEAAAAESEEEIQKQIEATAEAIKAKDPKDLADDEKEFLVDFEAGTLKDYTPPKKVEEKPVSGFDELAKNLIKDGVLVDLEDLEDSEEGFAKAINKTLETKVEEWVNEIPEDYRNVIDHLRTGGDVNSYLQARASVDYENLDYTNPQIQEALVKAELAQQGHTPEEIEEKLTDLKDLEKMEKEAIRASKIFDKQQTERIEAENKKIEEAIAAQEKAELAEVEEISTTIDKMDDIVGFKLTDKRREAFKKYLFDVDDAGETAASKASQDVEDRIKLYFMSFIDFNFEDLEKSVTTKKTKDLSKLLNRFKDTQTKGKGVKVEEKNPNPEPEKLVIPSFFNGPQED